VTSWLDVYLIKLKDKCTSHLKHIALKGSSISKLGIGRRSLPTSKLYELAVCMPRDSTGNINSVQNKEPVVVKTFLLRIFHRGPYVMKTTGWEPVNLADGKTRKAPLSVRSRYIIRVFLLILSSLH
jgi:hypothetical protein